MNGPSSQKEDGSYPHSTGLKRWLQRLHERDMPVLGNTVASLCQASDDRTTSAGDLAAVVLRDAAMTSRVLKLANSAYYNPGGYEISTISRAVVMLGFETVRSIGLSVAVIDTFLRGKHKTKMVGLMRQAVYAAVEAKAIARQMRDPAPEEIFIAALLYQLGEMAFWSFADENESGALANALTRNDGNSAAAEMEVLGCTLRMLTAGLAKEWRLSGVLQEALETGERGKGRSAQVVLGHALERAVREHGWDSVAVRKVTEKIAAHMKVQPERAREIINDSRQALEQAADAFGVTLDLEKGGADPAARTARRPVREPQPMLQLKILRELSAAIEKKPDIQFVLDMVMEGIYRGIALDRTLLAVLSPDRMSLRVKYVLGDTNDQLADAFRLQLDDDEAAFVRTALARRGSFWYRHGDAARPTVCRPAQVAADCFVAPLSVRGRDIGLIYADCALSRRPLDADSFEAFGHFIAQANLSLAHLTRR